MPAPMTSLPAVIAHADWGCDPRQRQVAMARLRPGGDTGPRYLADSLAAAPDGSQDVLDAVAARAGSATALVGFDFTIGLPAGYAVAAGVTSFPAFLAEIGSPPWEEFEHVAERPDQITLHRPFYPQRPGGTHRSQLYDGLGLPAAQLRRWCDGQDAETLFWTLGRKQAGKASLHGWRLLRSARSRGRDIAIWPFEGTLPGLLSGGGRVVVAEAYPREFYRYIGVPPRARWSKRRRSDRLECVPALLHWARDLGVTWQRPVRSRVTAGFSDGGSGEDEFDAVVGLLGLISVVTGRVPVGLPANDPAVSQIEGWILGRQADLLTRLPAAQTAPNKRSPASPRPGTM
jgi:hypothetical protein